MRLRSFFMTGDNIPSKYNFSWYLRHCWRKFMHTLAALKRRQPTLTLSREQDHLVLSRKKKNSAEKMSQAFASPVHERTYQQALSYERTTPRLQLAANDEKYFTASGKIPTAFFRRRNVIYKKSAAVLQAGECGSSCVCLSAGGVGCTYLRTISLFRYFSKSW